VSGHTPFEDLSRKALARPGVAERLDLIRPESEAALLSDSPAAVEFTVHVDSIAGVGDDNVLARFADAMAQTEAPGAACGMTREGALSATFQVEARSPQQAGGIAAIVVAEALRAAGVAEPLIELDRVDAYRGLPR
jgi:hypothetical protein